MKRFAVQIILTWVLCGVAASSGIELTLFTCIICGLMAGVSLEVAILSAERDERAGSDNSR